MVRSAIPSQYAVGNQLLADGDLSTILGMEHAEDYEPAGVHCMTYRAQLQETIRRITKQAFHTAAACGLG